MQDQRCHEEYIRRIHKVQDYIENNLEKSLSIHELSNAAGFSKYHFSRIFQAMLKEPLAHYVNRIRMEKALFLLARRSDKNMTDIAYELGYTDSAIFSRSFKNYYNISPSEYRKDYSKNCKDSFLLSEYNKNTYNRELGENLFPVKGQIEILNLEEKKVVYVRHIGTYETLKEEYGSLMQMLFEYADKQQLMTGGGNCLLTMYHDNPEFGDESQFRSSLCLTVPADAKIEENGLLGSMKLAGGMYAVGHFKIFQEQYSHAWNYMYLEWFSRSGYVPRNYYPFELYRNNPYESEDGIHEVDIYLPIEEICF